MNRRRVVAVPASSANLGPGYDVLAAALELNLELEVEETGEFAVECEIEGIPLDETNLCVRAFAALASPEGMRFRISSDIPTNGGLGSSAAAIVAGLAAADHMFELDAPLYEHAAAIEGHPDNVAAALYGGIVICGEGEPVRIDPAQGLEGILAVPPVRVPTVEARAAMPAEVPLTDAAFNVASAAQLALGLARSDFSLIGRGLGDRIHQPRRAHLYPRSMELVEQAPSFGALGATVSGAGPSVLLWCHWQTTGDVLAAVQKAAPDCAVRRVNFAPGGADVRELE